MGQFHLNFSSPAAWQPGLESHGASWMLRFSGSLRFDPGRPHHSRRVRAQRKYHAVVEIACFRSLFDNYWTHLCVACEASWGTVVANGTSASLSVKHVRGALCFWLAIRCYFS